MDRLVITPIAGGPGWTLVNHSCPSDHSPWRGKKKKKMEQRRNQPIDGTSAQQCLAIMSGNTAITTHVLKREASGL
jgi:hypothetical protein